MTAFLTALAVAPILIGGVAYVLYPLTLMIAARLGGRRRTSPQLPAWPSVTITVPVYNAATSIRATLDHLLNLDYPRELLQILVISDASTDNTDEIVRSYANRGVELLRLPERRGKTVAENASLAASRGEILVNVDSTILVPASSLKPLVTAFADPTVGVASGRDVSTGSADAHSNRAESNYVGYEMWVRDLETRVGSIVGASGCFYGARRHVHARPLPPSLSWDFASALNARLQGLRAVSVNEAVCIVPRTAAIRTELNRKVRTMARGLGTLLHYRELMNPFKYGSFALMLICHKLLRWLPYLVAPIAYLALSLLALEYPPARVALALVSLGIIAGAVGIRLGRARIPKALSLAGFIIAVFAAGFLAWIAALRQAQYATWEPTPRPEIQT